MLEKEKTPTDQSKAFQAQSKDNNSIEYNGTIYQNILPGKHLLSFMKNGRRHTALINHNFIINNQNTVIVKQINGGLAI